ncbi:carboxynorspermidine decarboxylase [Pseudobacteriovorax antillogorgiicola]|uniref:Carboxynorspermidine/carboxyspermidine decarboxylase n=1 Tax=Pseudobacteriovorax antillogorgiicola TaxID=1513793 RepID=A0A1Y6C4P3_9BACT|nr:carboxynorspermidine decarboxylase [Pseudobacteriovorax antillogorgiicola]TCS49863.1 carboxynorspermidine decarboxylase [Pseudobacteriovorax antillogorgiicola]SMF43809.1 carboxynorspermidine decarboxylase [Pseudobacteriovorax antillogorgiicola]
MTDDYFSPLHRIDPAKVAVSPSWVVDLGLLEDNLKILKDVQERAGCKILLALKGFATWSTFPLVAKYLSGATASSPHEAQLAREELGKEVHSYAPAYSDSDLDAALKFSDHIVFNSLPQWQRYKSKVKGKVSCGLRINPEHREVEVALYDPCAPRSRLGVRGEEIANADLDGIEGLHFHTLCELGSDALERTLAVVERNFKMLLEKVKWVNFGGGHHITRPGYDRDRLIRLIKHVRDTYNVDVYLEPGEAIAIRTGNLVTTVLDIIDNDGKIAILDCSATAHMPDVLEMPYRPEIIGGAKPGEKKYNYLLGGLTCLAGDVLGEYSFDEPLEVGDRLSILDMSHYTIVKTSNFNGVQLPAITLIDQDGNYKTVKEFPYETFKDRLS